MGWLPYSIPEASPSPIKKAALPLLLDEEICVTFMLQKIIFERERQTLVSSPRLPTVVFRWLVVIAVLSWDEDADASYNTHDRRRIFVKESVVSHDSALFVSLISSFLFLQFPCKLYLRLYQEIVLWNFAIATVFFQQGTYEQATGLSSIPFVWVGEPQSLLIQGKGWFNCSAPGLDIDLCNSTNPECSPHVLTVAPEKTYRLRIGSLTSLSALSIEIEDHYMTVVDVDGYNVEPFVVKNLYIYSGETYSVLIKADQDRRKNYWIVSKIVSRDSTTPNGLAIFNYFPNNPSISPPTVPPIGPAWDDVDSRLTQSQAIKARQGYIIPPPQKSDRTIVMLNTQNIVDGYPRWSINNVSFYLPNTPYLIAVKFRLDVFNQTPPPESYDYLHYDIFSPPKNVNATSSNSIYKLSFNSVVDIIIQNANTMKRNNSETHPWHLHGHDFWVLGHGKGKFDIQNDPKKFNLVNPIMKNTVSVQPWGWAALRFRADNPGVWYFHCHLEFHLFLGMGVAFEEGVERLDKLPTSIMGCGDVKGIQRP